MSFGIVYGAWHIVFKIITALCLITIFSIFYKVKIIKYKRLHRILFVGCSILLIYFAVEKLTVYVFAMLYALLMTVLPNQHVHHIRHDNVDIYSKICQNQYVRLLIYYEADKIKENIAEIIVSSDSFSVHGDFIKIKNKPDTMYVYVKDIYNVINQFEYKINGVQIDIRKVSDMRNKNDDGKLWHELDAETTNLINWELNE